MNPGRARVLGDDVNTDYIISSRRKKDSLDPQVLRHYLLEDLAPAFAASVQPGDILVAGRNFGCGSAMEVAVTVVRGAGIQAVVARSFARTYWRNAVNNGLLALTADTHGIAEGARLDIEVDGQGARIRVDGGRIIEAEPLPEFVLAMREAGGLLPYLRAHGRLM
ncbi:alpha-IPM isomerase [Ramlibacter tataouinensis]|uniref:Alpha-IPM isomerase n=1 Tax=Ramlibacter tataouinensis (strain ATCC BAA-407 / DSM 14655 / LMG 21543 / TTB310) TaxID=365046 RepID=F5Y6F9_RAMTT|nr:alpha-IPM isomerase [Ramlibacter tataouinensis]AEG94033.1 Alpha-IPM isomerase [Ramlibacter tataouinensis TTB310]